MILEGSAASYLIDILAYNTYYASFTANMSMNESFLESATVRDNIVEDCEASWIHSKVQKKRPEHV